MQGIDILETPAKRSISVRLSPRRLLGKQKKAVLLSSSGVQLKTFLLVQEVNELQLHNIAAGIYSIKVEADDEVMVRQIRIV